MASPNSHWLFRTKLKNWPKPSKPSLFCVVSAFGLISKRYKKYIRVHNTTSFNSSQLLHNRMPRKSNECRRHSHIGNRRISDNSFINYPFFEFELFIELCFERCEKKLSINKAFRLAYTICSFGCRLIVHSQHIELIQMRILECVSYCCDLVYQQFCNAISFHIVSIDV